MRVARFTPRAAAAALLLAGCGWSAAQGAAAAGASPGATLALPPAASGAASAPAVAPSVALGRRAYTSYCTRCHGINLVVSSSAFYDLRTFPKDDKARFVRSVTQGVRAMPAWAGIVKPEEVESIWLFMASVNGWTTP